ncbi:MAG: hypothetical protein R3C09_10690, partial [Pirellulaceae bacterium]
MEYDLRTRSYQQMIALPALPDIPLAVIYGGKTIDEATVDKRNAIDAESLADLNIQFARGQEELAEQASASLVLVSEIHGHDLHKSDPEIVVKAID